MDQLVSRDQESEALLQAHEDGLSEARAASRQRRSPSRNEPESFSPADRDIDKRDERPADKPDAREAEAGDKPKRRFAVLRDHPYISLAVLVLTVAAIVGGIVWWLHARHFESTDDAFVDVREFAIAPKVGGYIVDVRVTDNEKVRSGQLLFRIDPRDYAIAVEQAQANVAQTEAQIGNVDAQIEAQRAQIDVASALVQQADAALTLARQEEARASELVSKGAGTLQTEQQRRATLAQAQADSARARASLAAAQRQLGSLQAQRKSAEANRAAALAQLDQARLNETYTQVKAAQDGRIAKLTGAVGQFVQPGQAITQFVPDRLWITANFKETQITDMRPGQPVDIEIDAYPDREIKGRVDSVQPGSGTAFSLLPAENATGNYVKVVQRVPVKIVFDNVPDDITLGPGMSVVPKVKVR